MKTLMLTIMACCSMIMTACGDDKIENEQNNMVSAKSENTDTKGEETTEENDSTNVNGSNDIEGWNIEELDDIVTTGVPDEDN